MRNEYSCFARAVPFFRSGSARSASTYFSRSAIPVSENNFAGGNAGRYGTAELDDLIERYARTIPFSDRMGILGDIVQHQTDQVTILPLFFQGAAFVLGAAHLNNVLSGQVWNANAWELD